MRLLTAVAIVVVGGVAAHAGAAVPQQAVDSTTNPPAERADQVDQAGANPPPASPASVPDQARPSFADFLDGIRTEALARGIRQDIVDAALADVQEPVAVVLERDRSQAETVLSLEAYLARRLTPAVVKAGRESLVTHRVLLDEISARYGVPVNIIVAIWGMESNFGRFSGVRPTIAALATLAWDPRRATFFRGELFAALDIVNRGDIELARMRGSWAGAMGQLQFMPSSYVKFAEDFDGDGRRDIWSSPPDIFASIGNYLKGNGWIAGEPWGREVSVPPAAAARISATVARRRGGCQARRDMTIALPMEQWRGLGVRAANGAELPAADIPEAALVSGASRDFLVHHNYDALLEYNCAHSYAIGVGELAGRIIGPAPVVKAPLGKTSARRKSATTARKHPAKKPAKRPAAPKA